jgi:hypothetical protein
MPHWAQDIPEVNKNNTHLWLQCILNTKHPQKQMLSWAQHTPDHNTSLFTTHPWTQYRPENNTSPIVLSVRTHHTVSHNASPTTMHSWPQPTQKTLHPYRITSQQHKT